MNKDRITYRVLMLFLSNSVLQMMGFAYRIALGRTASAESLGMNSLVMQLYGIIASVCIYGLNVAVTSLAARTKKEETGALLKSALIVYVCLWVSVSVPLFALGNNVSAAVLGDIRLRPTLSLMLLCIFMTGIENVLKSIHLGTKNVKSCAVSETVEQGVRFLLVLLLLKKAESGCGAGEVFLIMLGMTLGETVSVSFLTISYLKLFPSRSQKRGTTMRVKELSITAFPSALTFISSTLFASVGALVLPHMLIRSGMTRGAALSLIGSVNNSLVPVSMLPSVFVGAVASVIMPEISRLTSIGRDPSKLIGKAFRTTAAFSVFASSLLLVLSGRILSVLFGAAFEPATVVLLFVKAQIIFFQLLSIAVLNGVMKQKKVFVYALTGESYQLFLILLLTPALGFAGYIAGMIIGELMRLCLNLSEIRQSTKNCGFCGDVMIKSIR